jgi:hypothetical protein
LHSRCCCPIALKILEEKFEATDFKMPLHYRSNNDTPSTSNQNEGDCFAQRRCIPNFPASGLLPHAGWGSTSHVRKGMELPPLYWPIV